MWNSIADGETIGTKGSENGIILKDDELSNENNTKVARITLEKGGYTPFAVTCGVYGLMCHTAFANEYDEAAQKYDGMKEAIESFVGDSDNDADDWCGWFTDRF
jgi:hypothetical protein